VLLPDATAAVVIAHGSRAEAANEAHRAVCAALAERTGGTVAAAFLELAEPSLDAAVAGLVASGTERIVVLPFFLYPGRHIQRDIPALVEAARAANPTVEITIGPLFGADPAVIDLLADQVRDAAEDR
jgi:sirohydrochlorin ferrochelatase